MTKLPDQNEHRIFRLNLSLILVPDNPSENVEYESVLIVLFEMNAFFIGSHTSVSVFIDSLALVAMLLGKPQYYARVFCADQFVVVTHAYIGPVAKTLLKYSRVDLVSRHIW